jgi:pimeloyl-ACP methyl ester carboxylesterase
MNPMAKSDVIVNDEGTWIWKDNDAREPNLIVFVHGYTGDPETTWVKFPHLIRQIGQGFEHGYEVASFGYQSRLTRNYQSVKTISHLLLTFLDAQADEASHLFIIAHSLGGIVARRMLVDSFTSQDNSLLTIFTKCRQVHFIGVPHRGAALAPKQVEWFRKLNPLAADLRRNSPLLLKTLTAWNDVVKHCEDKGLPSPQMFNYVGNQDWLIPLEQTIEHFAEREQVRVVEGNHIGIAKPHHPENAVYRLVRRHIINAGKALDPQAVETAAQHAASGQATPEEADVLRRAFQLGLIELASELSDTDEDASTRPLQSVGRRKQTSSATPSMRDTLVKVEHHLFYGHPGSPPPPPGLFIGREGETQALKNRLGLTSNGHSDADVSCLTVRGWPGVGKTTLLTSLAHDRDIRCAYPDGVLWTSLGQSPELLAALATWGRAVGSDELLRMMSVDEAVAGLRGLLHDRCMLLIVDDVWQIEHAEAFRRAAPYGCQLLFTTRDQAVAQAIGPTPGSIYVVPELTEESALQLLAALAPQVVKAYPDECRTLVQDIECLPLALHVAGGMLAAEFQLGLGVEELLQEIREGRTLLDQKAPADMTDLEKQTLPTVAVLLEKSTSRLEPSMRDYFAFLGAFAPKPATFDLAALRAVWDIDDAKPIVRELVSRGLLEAVGGGRFQMHALLVAHAEAMLEE